MSVWETTPAPGRGAGVKGKRLVPHTREGTPGPGSAPAWRSPLEDTCGALQALTLPGACPSQPNSYGLGRRRARQRHRGPRACTPPGNGDTRRPHHLPATRPGGDGTSTASTAGQGEGAPHQRRSAGSGPPRGPAPPAPPCPVPTATAVFPVSC